MKFRISSMILIAAAALTLSSCEKERLQPAYDTDDRAICIVPEIASAYTKSNPITSGKETAFNEGDMIALLCDDGHVTFKLSDKGWTPTDNYYLRWGGSPVTYRAFYPATESSTTFGNFELPSAQRSLDKIAAADYMTSIVEDAVNPGNGELHLKMERQMAKVSFRVSGIETGAKVQGVRIYTFTGFSEGVPTTSRMYVSPYAEAPEGGAAGQNGTTYTAIVVPSSADDSETFLSLNYKGQEIKVNGVPQLNAGFEYSFALDIDGTTISVGEPIVSPWEDGTVVPGGDASKVALAPYFVKPDAAGTKDGSSWENAFGMAEFLEFVKQKEDNSEANAENVEDRDFHFAGGEYSFTPIKIEFSGHASRVEFRVYGGYDQSSTGTDVSRRDVSAYETVFNGSGANRFFTLGNQIEPLFDGITFANGLADGDGCIMAAAGGSGDARATFRDCTFRVCVSNTAQIPLIVVKKGFLKFDNTVFEGCSQTSGSRGLIRCWQNCQARVYMNACRFVNNSFSKNTGFGMLCHLNSPTGLICLHNVTFAGNDTESLTYGVLNGTGGMLVSSSTLSARNVGSIIRCESDPASGSLLVNNLLIQEQDRKVIEMSAGGSKALKSSGGNILVGNIDSNDHYTASSSDDSFATMAKAFALAFDWNADSATYLWNGMTSFTKMTSEQIRSAIRSYSNTKIGNVMAGDEVVYDGSRAGEDFLGWLDSIDAFGKDGFGNFRDASAWWPGAYQGNSPKCVMMGDSITERWFRNRPEFFRSNGFICAGIGGQTTSQMLTRFEGNVIANSPQVVSILGGINDIAQNQGYISIDDICKNITTMAEMARAKNITVILCSVLPSDKIYWNDSIEPAPLVKQLNEKIKAYAEANSIPYLDYWTRFATETGGLPDNLTEDGVHVTTACYEQMEQMFLDCLNQVK